MDGSSYENLRSSFTLEEPLFGGDASIDSLCQTYLGNMDTFSSGLGTHSDALDAHSNSLSLDYYGCTLNINNLSLDSHSPRMGSLSPRLDSHSPRLDSLSPRTDSHSPIFGSHSPRLDSHCSRVGSQSPNNSGLLEEIEAFSKMEIKDWRGEDCLDWAGSVCRRRGLDQSTLDLWSFRGTSGAHLMQYSCQDFCCLVGSIYGPLFHQEFSQLLQDRQSGNKLHHQASQQASPYGDYLSPDLSYDASLTADLSYGVSATPDPWDLTTEDIKDLDRYIQEPSSEPLAGGLHDMDLLEQSVPIQYENLQSTPEPVALVSAGRESTTFLASSDPLQKIRPDAKKRERGPKNWEFVIRLLADPQTNPSLIRWEEQSQGTFRLVQPAVIARMWGQRADRPNLSYDNFARGLRYHYTTGALQPVSEKQLVYRCGPKALKYLIDLKKQAAP